MDNNIVQIIERAMEEVKETMSNCIQLDLHYHNWQHTLNVINACDRIASGTDGITEDQKINLKLASIYHDVGYLTQRVGHEDVSANIAGESLLKLSVETKRIEEIQKLIMATRIDHNPNNLLEEIIKDADLAHLANDDYLSTDYQKLYKEMNADVPMSPEAWRSKCIDFVESHVFYTQFCRDNLETNKQKNMNTLKENGSELPKKLDKTLAKVETAKTKGKGKGKKSKSNQPDKGVETMFRVALRNHINLSRIADSKANTLISVNGIIISVVISALLPKMDNNPYLIYPGGFLIAFSILTLIMAIMSIIPKATPGRVSKEDVEARKGNLIFFGNFHKMSLSEFEWSIDQLMNDKDYLYKNLTRDLYFLGKVLNKKYTLLRYSYVVFITGLLLSITFFFVSMNGMSY